MNQETDKRCLQPGTAVFLGSGPGRPQKTWRVSGRTAYFRC